jgi:hypothetical protein
MEKKIHQTYQKGATTHTRDEKHGTHPKTKVATVKNGVGPNTHGREKRLWNNLLPPF